MYFVMGEHFRVQTMGSARCPEQSACPGWSESRIPGHAGPIWEKVICLNSWTGHLSLRLVHSLGLEPPQVGFSIQCLILCVYECECTCWEIVSTLYTLICYHFLSLLLLLIVQLSNYYSYQLVWKPMCCIVHTSNDCDLSCISAEFVLYALNLLIKETSDSLCHIARTSKLSVKLIYTCLLRQKVKSLSSSGIWWTDWRSL